MNNKNQTTPFQFKRDLENKIRSYLYSTNGFSDNLYEENKKLWKYIEGSELLKGPFIEKIPNYKKESSLQELIEQNILTNKISDFFGKESFPLYSHQCEAIKAFKENKNYIVSTGTGSGKTESFLIPLIDFLANHDHRGKGIKAIIVYPMNALANDQMYYRISQVLANYLKNENISFARFTGDTPKQEKDRNTQLDKMLDDDKLKNALNIKSKDEFPDNWKITREEILETPPDILITNHAMLEYILTIPYYQSILNEQLLEYIVLDELHLHSGVQASDLSYLLQRLVYQTKNSEKNIKYIGTTASLPDEPKKQEEVANFFETLTDKPFSVENIITEKHDKYPKPNITKNPIDWSQHFYKEDDQLDVEQILDYQETQEKSKSAYLDYCSDPKIQILHDELENKNIVHFDKILDKSESLDYYSKEDKEKALVAMLSIGAVSKAQNQTTSFINCKYHFITKIPDPIGIDLKRYLQALKNQDETQYFFNFYEYNHPNNESSPFYKVFTCDNCQNLYIEGWYDNKDQVLFSKNNEHFSLSRKVYLVTNIKQNKEHINSKNFRYLDLNNLTVSKTQDPNKLELIEGDVKIDEEEGRFYLKECVACNTNHKRNKAEAIRDFGSGLYGISSLVAQQTFESLPSNNEKARLGGRKVISFSDNRQRAAFFASYFEESYNNNFLINLIYTKLKENTDASGCINFDDFWNHIFQDFIRTHNIKYPKMQESSSLPNEVKLKMRYRIFKENIFETRNLGKIIAEKHDFLIKESLKSAHKFLSTEINLEQIASIIDFFLSEVRLRSNGALFYDYYDANNPVSKFNEKPLDFSIDEKDYDDSKVFSIGKIKGRNKLLSHIKKAYPNTEDSNVSDFLKELFRIMKKETEHIITNNGSNKINNEKILIDFNSQRYQCSKCLTKTYHNINSACINKKCDGKLEVDKSPIDYYQQLYTKPLDEKQKIDFIRANEHTSSIEKSTKDTIESDFRKGEINLLSSTTTLEVGIDLDDLNAVINLNLPPKKHNYQQRIGRAGRKDQLFPFSTTIATNSNFDNYYFKNFNDYLKNKVDSPFIQKQNTTIQQKQFFAILHYYLLEHILKNDEYWPTIEELLDIRKNDLEYLRKYYEELSSLIEFLGIKQTTQHLIDKYIEFIWKYIQDKNNEILERQNYRDEIIDKKEEEIEKIEKERENEPSTKKRKDLNKQKENIENTIEKLKNAKKSERKNIQNLRFFEEVKKEGLFPSYGFGANELTLEFYKKNNKNGLKPDNSIQQNPLFGIVEYSPGMQHIYDKQYWTVNGIKNIKNLNPDTICICRNELCEEIFKVYDNNKKNCPYCGTDNTLQKTKKSITPHTFVSKAIVSKPVNVEQERLHSFITSHLKVEKLPKENSFEKINESLSIRYVSNSEEAHSYFININQGPYGRGFYVCDYCGFAKKPDSKSAKHIRVNDPENKWCSNTNLTPHYFHNEFKTDYLILQLNTEKIDLRKNYQSTSITLAETFRIAAAKILGVQISDIKATFQKDKNSLKIILLDAIYGGVGYIEKLYNEFPIQSVVEKAIKILNCNFKCDNGCFNCIYDYTNQKHWEQFEREKTLKVLETVNDDKKTIKTISINDLYKKALEKGHLNLSSYKIFESRINEYSDDDNKKLEANYIYQKIDELLSNNIQVNFYLRENNNNKGYIVDHDKMQNSSTALKIIKRFSSSSSFHVYLIQNEKFFENIPKFWFNDDKKGYFRNIDSIEHDILFTLENENNTQVIEDSFEVSQCDFLNNTKKHASNLEFFKEIEHHHFNNSDSDRLNKVFNFIDKKSSIAYLTIDDPYLGKEEHASMLRKIIDFIYNTKQSKIDKVYINYYTPNGDDSEIPISMLKQFYSISEIVSKDNEKFHDRQIIVEMGGDDPFLEHQRYEIKLTNSIGASLDNKNSDVFIIKK